MYVFLCFSAFSDIDMILHDIVLFYTIYWWFASFNVEVEFRNILQFISPSYSNDSIFRWLRRVLFSSSSHRRLEMQSRKVLEQLVYKYKYSTSKKFDERVRRKERPTCYMLHELFNNIMLRKRKQHEMRNAVWKICLHDMIVYSTVR